MKKRFAWMLLFALPFAACIKTYIIIPKPPSGSAPGGSAPAGTPAAYGVSAVVNGKYTTFNSFLSVDTSYSEFSIIGSGDSVPYQNYQLDMVFSADNAPFVTGLYLYQPNSTPYSAAFTLYTQGPVGRIGFCAYNDTTIVTNITDTTITGTFVGKCEGAVRDAWGNMVNSDSVVPVTNGKFYLKRATANYY